MPLSVLREGIPLLNEIIETQTDESILSDACWALSYISDGSNQEIQAVLDSVNLKKLLSFLDMTNHNLVTPTLRLFGNIVTGDDVQTQKIVDLGIISYLKKFIKHTKVSVVVEVCWFISNLTAGTREQIQVNDLIIVKLLLNEIKIMFYYYLSGGHRCRSHTGSDRNL